MSGTITVNGTGSASGSPDLATVNLGVEIVGRSVAEARVKAAADAAAVIAALRKHGIQGSDLKTSAYGIHPEYDHRDGRRLRGYRITNTLEAVVRDLSSVGSVVDAAAAAAADSTVVHSLSFGFEDSRGLDEEARQAAWDDARRRAQQLADLAGVGLGRAASIVEQTYSAPQPAMRAMAMEAAVETPIEAGQHSITVTINVEFRIENS